MLARKIILGFGFAILLPMLIQYGIEVIVPSPELRKQYEEIARLRQQETALTSEAQADVRRQVETLERAQQQQRLAASRAHFFVGAPLGILITLLGSFVRVQAIGGGLMLGGICTFTSGCAWYWGDLPRTGRFGVLLAAFVVLLWIGYQRLSDLKSPTKSA